MRRLFFCLSCYAVAIRFSVGRLLSKSGSMAEERMGNKTRFAKLLVTYQHHSDPQGKVSCRVLDENSAVIAADSGNAVDFVAHLTFRLKEKYRHQEISVMCE